MPAFNLLDEPWIPVRSLAGEVSEIGLLELFERASQLEGLAETSPPNLVALYRVLLAITHRALTRALGTWKDADRARWYQDGLPDEVVRDYLEHWRDRFWVFHPEHPFMQVAALAAIPETKEKLKPWTQVAFEKASGDTPVVFDHSSEPTLRAESASAVLRHILGYLQFTPYGLVRYLKYSDTAGALANTAACIPSDATLLRALVMSLHPPSSSKEVDRPCWEKGPPTLSDLKAKSVGSTGPNDRYTRLSRSVLLLRAPGEDHMVRVLHFAAGISLAKDNVDPMVSYWVREKGPVPLRFTSGRALWRELPTLLPDASGKFSLPAPVLGWARNLQMELGLWDRQILVLVAGLASDDAKLLRWRTDRLVLPAKVLIDPDAAQSIRQAVGRAEKTFYSLRGIAADMLAAMMPNAKHKDTRARARALLDASGFAATFFAHAERALPLLFEHVVDGEIDAADLHWSRTLVTAAEYAWDDVLTFAGRSPAALRAEALVWPRFRHFVRSIDSPSTQDATSGEEIDA